MSTLLQQLTARNLQHYGVSKPSFESAEHEDHEDQVEEQEDDVELDEGFGEDGLTIQDLEEMGEDLDKKCELHESFESLLVGTINAYGIHGMNERGAELYRLSVESLFKQYGMDDFDKVVVPSFEDSATREEHTEKTVEKADGVLKRIWASLVAAYEAFTTAVGDFFRRIFTGAVTIEKAVGRLKEKVKGMGAGKGEALKMGVAGRYLVNKSGSPLTGADQIHELMADMQKFGGYWIHAWEGLTDSTAVKKMSNPESMQNLFQQIISGSYMLKRITDEGSFQMNPLPNHRMAITGEQKEGKPFTVSSTEFEFVAKAPASVPALDKAGAEHAIEAVEKAVAAYRKLDTEVQKRLKSTKDFISQVKVIQSRLGLIAKIQEKEGRSSERAGSPAYMVRAAKSLIAGNKVLQFGWTKVLSQFLQYLRANLKHVDASIRAAGKGKAEAETKADESGKKDDTNEEKK